MKHFIDFVHFLNSENKFVFEDVPKENIAANLKKDGTYDFDSPSYEQKSLKYKEYTITEFKKYINSIKNVVKNEIQDVFDKELKDDLIEIRNKLKLLIDLNGKYILITFFDVNYRWVHDYSIFYPEKENDYFNLSPEEKSKISEFLEMEKKSIIQLIKTIQKLEYTFPFKNRIGNPKNVKGFEFETLKQVNLAEIYDSLQNKIIDCSYDDFKEIFGGKVFNKPKTKVKWLLNNPDKSDAIKPLIFFLKSSIFKKTINDDELKQKISLFFTNSAGISFKDKNLSVAFKHYHKNYIDSARHITKIPLIENIKKIEEYL